MPDSFDFSMLAASGQPEQGNFAPIGPIGGLAPQPNLAQPPQTAQAFTTDVPPELKAQLERLRGFQANMVATNQQNKQLSPPEEVTMYKDTKTGAMKMDITGLDKDTYEALMRDRQQLNEIRGSFHQEAQRLQAQEERVASQPWAQLATALSANMAQQQNMPGWVQAAGRTAAQLNPNVDQIRARRLQVLGQEAGFAEKSAALNAHLAQIAEGQANRNYTMNTAAEKERKTRVEQTADNLAHSVGQGPGEVDPEAVAASLRTAGATPEEIKAIGGNLGILAKNIAAKYQRDSAKQVALEQAKIDAENARDKRFNTSQENISERARLAQTGQDTRQEERLKQAEFVTANGTYNRNTSLSPSEQTSVESAFKTLNLVDKMADLDKSQSKGPISGAIQYLNPWRNAEWQQIMNYSDQLLLSGLNGKLGSGVSDMDVKVMRGVMPSGKMTQEQYDSTVKVLRTLSPENLQRLMVLNPNVQYWKNTAPLFKKYGMEDQYKAGMEQMKAQNAASYPELFGPDRPEIADRIFGKDTKFTGDATTSGPAAGAKDSGGPRQKVTKNDEPIAIGPDGKEYVVRGGKWVPK